MEIGMSLKQDLIATRALIDTPAKWRKRAGDEGEGTPCCMVVAANRFTGSYYSERHRAIRDALFAQLPGEFREGRLPHGGDLGIYNDDPATTHADIMALFDRAINAA